MKLLVLANEELKQELLAGPIHPIVEWQWVAEPFAFDNPPAISACIDLLFENDEERIIWLKKLNAPLVIVNSIVSTLTEIDENFIRINGWRSFLKRPVAEVAGNNGLLRKKTEELLELLGRKVEWVPDICGFVTPRIVCSIINEAFFSLEEKISTREEIDIAMKTGTNYPYGPFEWAEKIGLQKIYGLMEKLRTEQARYTPSDLLKQTALA